jgi:hypothetical protein
MPRVQPSPFDSKVPFGFMLNESQGTFVGRWERRLSEYCNRIMPEGYQDEEGFHLGAPQSGRGANWLGENI